MKRSTRAAFTSLAAKRAEKQFAKRLRVSEVELLARRQLEFTAARRRRLRLQGAGFCLVCFLLGVAVGAVTL